MRTTINIPEDIQSRIIDIAGIKNTNHILYFFSDDIIGVLNSDTFIDDVCYADLLDNGDEVTVYEVASDIYLEYVDHVNSNTTINYYKDYEI